MKIISVLFKKVSLAGFVFIFIVTSVLAGVSVNELIQAGMPASLAQFGAKVSSNEGNWTSVNQYGCLGAFQFCPGTFEMYYSGSRKDFLNKPNDQIDTWIRYQQNEWRKAQKNGLDGLVGKSICYRGRCASVTESSVLMACQFGCGKNGKLDNLINNGLNCEANSVKDGNGKSVCDYLISGAGYNVSDITSHSENGSNGSIGESHGVCLTRSPWSEAGEKVISPYGQDRSTRPNASSGYHQGLDIVNSAGRGDPLYASINGRIFQATSGSGGLRVITETGNQRFIWMHLNTISPQPEVGNNVSPVQIGTMGGSGTINNALVHHHLGVLLRGDALQTNSETDKGRVFKTGDGQFSGSKMSQPLSSLDISQASPKTWYFVNPETFLHKRIPFDQNTLLSYQLDRPDGLTLVNSCSVDGNSHSYSTNGGVSADSGVGNTFVGGNGDAEYELKTVSNSTRSFYLDMARQANSGAMLSTRTAQIGRTETDLSLGLLIINSLEPKI